MDIRSEDKIRLLDIADAIREIQGYLGASDFEDFNIRDDVREEVSTQMGIIGGAAAQLSDEFKEEYGNIDWDMLKGFQYAQYDEELEMDHHEVLFLAQNDLPDMLNDILDVASILEDEDDLEEGSLNEEDKQDLKAMQEERKNRSRAKAEEVFTDEDRAERRDMETYNTSGDKSTPTSDEYPSEEDLENY